MMSEDQQVNVRNQQKLSVAGRLIAGGIFAAIAAGFVLLWASANGHVNLGYWFGVCGFKQRFGLPCPGCGWTHAVEMFVTGHPLKALILQPAAGVFCVVFLLIAVVALHCAVFGIDSPFLQRVFCPKSVVFLFVAACFIIVVGWMGNLIRTILENFGL